MIIFKTPELFREFVCDDVTHDVRVLATMFAVYMDSAYGRDVIVTSVLGGEPGVKRKSTTHEEGRAVDISAAGLPPVMGKSVSEWINRNFSTGAYFPEGDAMDACVFHDVGYGPHWHLQVAKGRPLIFKTRKHGDMVI